MTDYTEMWEQEQARRLQAHLERTAARCGLLRDRYAAVRGMVSGDGPPGSGPAPRSRDEEVRRPDGAGRAPVNVAALDVVVAVERFTADRLPVLRGTLRVGTWRPPGLTRAERTASALDWMGRQLGRIWDEDPGLGGELSDEVWQLDRRAAVVLGERSRAFPLSELCGRCGVPALWASPERMQVKCGNPDCGAGWAVSAPVPVSASSA